MESKRQQKFSRLIQKELGELFQRDLRPLLGKAFVSITVVRTSPDLGLCKIYLSIMLADGNELIKSLQKEHYKEIRRVLGTKIRNQVRVIPELSFYLDDTAEYASKMDQIFSKLDIPPATSEDDEF